MKDDSPTLDELLAQASQGDREALGRLLEAQRTPLHRLAEHQVRGRVAVRVDASDVIQQTFLEAYRSFPQFAGQDVRELVAWLQSILDHKVAGAIRDQARTTLAAALSRARLHGIVTNRDLLVAILREHDFATGAIHTGYLDLHPPARLCAEGCR